MFCMHCGAELPDGAKFCSKCGKDVSQQQPPVTNAPPVAAVVPYADQAQEEEFRKLVKEATVSGVQGARTLDQYNRFPKDRWLQEAEKYFNDAYGLLKRIDELPLMKSKSLDERKKSVEKELEYQKVLVQTLTGVGGVSFNKGKYMESIQTIQRLVTDYLTTDARYMKDVLEVRKLFMDQVRKKDFATWKKIRKEVLNDEVRPEELSFFEKRFS